MLNGNNKPVMRLNIGKAMLNIKKMQDELEEHRYHLDRKIEQSTRYLLKHIALLESCNANLCDKLALAEKEIILLKKQVPTVLPKKDKEQQNRAVQLYGMNGQAHNPIGLKVLN